MTFLHLRTTDRAHRFRRSLRFVALFTALAVLATACSSSEVASPDAPDSITQPSTSPSLEADDGGGTTTTEADPASPSSSTSTTTTEQTTTTEPPLLATVSISASGDDANAGGPGAPVASVEQALTRLQPGGTIEFEPGVYAPLTLTNIAGLPDQPIRFVGGPGVEFRGCLLYTSPSPRDQRGSRMPSSA